MRPGGLFAVALIAVFAGSIAEAQGLGDAAAREKQRREQEQKKRGAAKVVTIDELSKTSSGDSPAGGSAQDQQRPDRESSSERRVLKEGTDEVVEAPKEAEWRQRAKEAKEELQNAEAQLRRMEEKASQLFGQIQASTDTNELLRLRAEQQTVTQQVEEARSGLETARKELKDLAEDARKAGVPPGWVR